MPKLRLGRHAPKNEINIQKPWPPIGASIRAGADVTILKIFSPKKMGEKMAFLTQTIAQLWKNWS
jgi:hypothetical protein